MTVRCPHCSTGYDLPEHLLGERGARVRCPSCGGRFVVRRAELEATPPRESTSGAGSGGAGAEDYVLLAGVAEAELLMSSPASAPPADVTPTREPAAVADQVLGVLARFLGEALTRSRARGTVLSDHGPMLMAVWEEYRRRVGPDAPAAVFRAALRDHYGVDLSPAHEA